MATTPVVMKIQDYKDREVRRYSRVASMDVRPLPEEGRRDSVLGDQDPEGDEDHQVHWRLLRRFRGELGRQARSL